MTEGPVLVSTEQWKAALNLYWCQHSGLSGILTLKNCWVWFILLAVIVVYSIFCFLRKKNRICLESIWPKNNVFGKRNGVQKLHWISSDVHARFAAEIKMLIYIQYDTVGLKKDNKKLKEVYGKKKTFIYRIVSFSLRDHDNYRRHLTNKAYGRSEYTMLLCASCIIFIAAATNYCIISPMTHFLVSKWLPRDKENLNLQPFW